MRFPFPNTPAFHHHLSLLHLFTAKAPIIAASPTVAVKGCQVEVVEVFPKSKDLPSALLAVAARDQGIPHHLVEISWPIIWILSVQNFCIISCWFCETWYDVVYGKSSTTPWMCIHVAKRFFEKLKTVSLYLELPCGTYFCRNL